MEAEDFFIQRRSVEEVELGKLGKNVVKIAQVARECDAHHTDNDEVLQMPDHAKQFLSSGAH
jgi:hypothetical protein